MATIELHKVAVRDKLPPRREPYWVRLEAGRYIGFRRMSKDTPGTWVARCRDAEGQQHHQSFGALDDLAPSARFDAGRQLALNWMKNIGGASPGSFTVGDACRAYAAHISQKEGALKAEKLDSFFMKRTVHSDPLANVLLKDLTRDAIKAWRQRLEAAPMRRGTGERSKSTINRDLVPLRAALNHALAEGWIGSSTAWDGPLKKHEGADGTRDVILTREQRRALLQHLDGHAKPFFEFLCLTPLRPGAAAALRVRDYAAPQHSLTIPVDKAGAGRRFTVPEGTSALLAGWCADRGPDEPIFRDAAGHQWCAESWGNAFRDAATLAGLPKDAVTYSLRHAVITDLLVAGLDGLTVARLAGTSMEQINRTYGHLLEAHGAKALAGLST